MIEIKNRWTEDVLYKSEKDNFFDAIVEAVLSGANLRHADLSGANLSDANLSDADLSDANLSDANLSGANLPAVEPMPELKRMIRERVEASPKCLNMQKWHTCETTHCLAGWATTLHPQGKLLESMIGPNAAGALIFNASCGEVPCFTSSDEKAMEWLRK